jgi:four helix bundle protein
MDPVEFKQWLEARTRAFAVASLKFLDALPKKNSTKIVAFQLGKSATSIGANYREANRAESRVDFGHKLQIAMKEASESVYWLEVLSGLYPMHETIKTLEREAIELRNLLQSISSSTRRKSRVH